MRCGSLVVPLALFAFCLAFACGSQQRPTASPAASKPSAALAARSVPLRLVASNLVGAWVEFWSVSGHADTQRYAFFEDGRFEWNAARDADAKVTRRWGQWKLESAGSPTAAGAAIALSVQGHAERFGCEGSADCRVLDDPQIEERLQLGDCPQNDEAKALDASYRCLSLGAHAFWHHLHAHEPGSAH
jgi:hypothetical protein